MEAGFQKVVLLGSDVKSTEPVNRDRLLVEIRCELPGYQDVP